ncbi:hypothetical protein EYZ11_001413 [Aspergillus tanneri]|uniref:Major facilitator superfamily (MFS) profile domain-containing protein n=1 Tax=Aspergillus tanneri TaxID=1220188 RepID=A0A4S3JUL7_9EURO|nr:hypothetical protein EYZ11_001413 [Aspergillus tanneri]
MIPSFCVSLAYNIGQDNTIITTAIPKITEQFNSLEDVGWYGSAYMLTTCVFTLSFGKLYTYYSTKLVFLIGLFIFEIGSLICGIAPNSVALIIGRAVAGMGAAGLYSGAILIIAQTVPLNKRPLYTGALGGVFGIASVVGPLMGGAFTDHLTWRWCFYINLPLGGLTFLFVLLLFKAPKPVKARSTLKNQILELDLLSMIFFFPAVVCLLLALQWGGSQYAWSDGRIIALFVLFGVLIIMFIGMQGWQGDRATVPPRLLKNRNVSGAIVFSFCLFGAFLAAIYYVDLDQIPIWFQAVKGVSATKSGIMNLPMVLGVTIMSLIAGVLTTVFGYYTPFMLLSPVIVTIGAGMLTTFKVDSGSPAWIGYQALFGLGVGMGSQQPIILYQTVLSPVDVPTATAMGMFTQTLGGALFVSVAQNIFNNQLRGNMATLAPHVDVEKVVQAGATMLRHVVSEVDLPGVLQAYSESITRTFFIAVAMGVMALFAALPIQWVSVRGKKIEMGAV